MTLLASENTSPPPQLRQFGPYQVHELINSGGTSDLWMATDSMQRIYAVRLLRDRFRFHLLSRRRFWRGAEILSKIHHHPFVIGYVDHGKLNGTLYLVMEYVEGSNLKLLAARNDPVLSDFVGNILIDSAEALEHVHDCGYIHLDFKPENILVSRNGNVRLVDFDLAQPKPEQPKRMSKNPGTVGYMAPEQLQRKPLDHRADIFAYGVLAYELLTGKKPFPGESAYEVLRQQRNRKLSFTTPRELNSDIPAQLEKIILKCLEQEPENRYPFTSVLTRDLQAHLYVK